MTTLVAATTPGEPVGAPARTMTYWATASDMVIDGKPSCYSPPCANWSAGSPAWDARFELIARHRANLTGLIPTMHAITNGGALGHNGDGSYHNWLPQIPRLRRMGLEVPLTFELVVSATTMIALVTFSNVTAEYYE